MVRSPRIHRTDSDWRSARRGACETGATFFGAFPYEQLAKVIDEELTRKGVVMAEAKGGSK